MTWMVGRGDDGVGGSGLECAQKHYKLLQETFRHYAAGPGGGSASTMSSQEFWKLIKDCALIDKKLTNIKVDLIFMEANRDPPGISRPKTPMTSKKEKDNPDSELVPEEYNEALLRIALERYPVIAKKSPAEAFEKLLEDDIEVHACKSNTGIFRAQLLDKGVQGVFRTNRKTLEKIFMYYCNADNPYAGKKTSMNCSAFATLLRDCRIIDGNLSEAVVQNIFVCVQNASEEDDDGDDPNGGEDEMVYTEFMEAIAAVSCYRQANPFISMANRLNHFLRTGMTAISDKVLKGKKGK
ncbi:hypothetical protein CYMTET_31296 [Cymbomonas tetramitiformis]|uniref:Uncharacterized protein n=1 Tax=Cymbomonas tetramitiformis TaxID=36881 RepID=A0AAE0FH92_9CHLO|nr:hypothetical protein CYMTET_31296 [Cymbomonas tetramitiformis]